MRRRSSSKSSGRTSAWREGKRSSTRSSRMTASHSSPFPRNGWWRAPPGPPHRTRRRRPPAFPATNPPRTVRAIGVGRGDVREFREALLAAGPVVGEYGLETRRVVLDDHFDERGGRQVVLAQLVSSSSMSDHESGYLVQALRSASKSPCAADVIDFFGGFGPHALGQPRHTLEGGHVQRVDRQPHERHHVLDVYGFRVTQPAVFAELDAAFGECDLKVVGLVARAEQHGDFLRLIAVEEALPRAPPPHWPASGRSWGGRGARGAFWACFPWS